MPKSTRRTRKIAVSKGAAAKVRESLRTLRTDDTELFPPHLHKVRELEALTAAPTEADSYRALIETICGTTDDSQPVEQYDGTLGVTTAFASAHQGPVGQIQWNDNLATLYTSPGDVSGVRWCSGTLIANDLFLAAGHCFDQTGGGWTRPKDNATQATIAPAEIATNMHVNFNFQVDASGNPRTEQRFPVTALVEYRLGSLDFAIVRLGGNPGATFGVTGVSTTDPAKGDMLAIIGHPAGLPKRIEAGPTTDLSGSSITYDDIDTLGGNSGSGILRASDGRLVGVHTNGGCTATGGSNSGVRITSIIAASPTLQFLTRPTIPSLKFLDDPNTLKFRDDHIPSLKFLDDPHTLKFRDDHIPSLKFLDDPNTLKFRDDGGGGGTLPAVDAPGTIKAVDDIKLPGFDKQPGAFEGIDPRVQPGGPLTGGGGPSPFILSTPHHSMAWTRMTGQPPHEEIAAYQSALTQMESVLQQGMAELAQLDAEYRQLCATYDELTRQQG